MVGKHDLPPKPPTDLYGEAGEVDAGTDHPLVVVGVHAHRVGLEIEGVLAILHLLQLILVQVWPSPDPRIDHMWKAFSPSDLQERCQDLVKDRSLQQ